MPGINRAVATTIHGSSSPQVRLNETRAMSAPKRDCVFISHQKQDSPFCKAIADYIMQAGLDVYFDEHDKDLRIYREANDPQGVTECILKGINNSNSMLCVVSPHTLGSTWVPFEVGYGYEKTELGILTTKGVHRTDLPHYAQTAKLIMDTVPDLNKFLLTRPSVITESQTRTFSTPAGVKLSVNSQHPLANVMNLS
jgi:hypothetical protein